MYGLSPSPASVFMHSIYKVRIYYKINFFFRNTALYYGIAHAGGGGGGGGGCRLK